MWEAFGRICTRRGTSRAARILEMIGSEIRSHGDAQDLADLEAAEEELRERRSRKGIRHRRKPHQDAGQEPSGAAANTPPAPLAGSPDPAERASHPESAA
jgi:hypothetical protein